MTKEHQREQLHRAIWNAANQLVHGGVLTPVQFMNYMLGGLFYRFISENITEYLNRLTREARKDPSFNYEDLSDKEAERARVSTIKAKGFFILPSQLFVKVAKNARNDQNLNETLEQVFKSIEGSSIGYESENDIKGLFDDFDVNSKNLGDTVAKRNEQLCKLLEEIRALEMGEFEAHVIDTFGDAYEYLISMYAANSGKKGGEFYTPQEVSELLTKITLVGKKEVNKVYDPACGSGSLLLNFAKVLGKDKVRQGFFGQEKIRTTYNLCRMNMFLHNINYDKFDIANGDTLKDPKHWDEIPFEAIVSNPPYSVPWEGDSNKLLIDDKRFSPAAALAPQKKADLAFVMHILYWLSNNGTAAIVEYPGVLYRSGSDQKIREYLVTENYVDAVIQLPQNLFFGTSIATCIIVLKKSKSENKTLFIDASQLFVHEGNKNKLSPENIAAIMAEYIKRKDTPHFSALVSNDVIGKNNYNLSVSNYVEAQDTRPQTDIRELNERIRRIVAHENELRTEIDKIIAELES